MPVWRDFSVFQYQDAFLTAPGLACALSGNGVMATSGFPLSGFTMSGMALRFLLQKRFAGQSGVFLAWAASGFNAVSGLTLLDSFNGEVGIGIPGATLSGMNLGLYAGTLERLDSGNRSVLMESWITVNQSAEA